MIRVLLVDDEAVLRSSLSTMVNWEEEGCKVVGSASNGKEALELLRSQTVDLIFTDIKMPIMDGIRLLDALSRFDTPPVTVALSAYNEFDLVRKAFRLGAQDYILKNDLNESSLKTLLISLKKNVLQRTDSEQAHGEEEPPGDRLRRMALGNEKPDETFLGGCWSLACLDIDNFQSVSLRFKGDLSATLIQPLIEFAHQVPRLKTHSVIAALSPSRYVLLFQGKEKAAQAGDICRQVLWAWKRYMNISASGGLSRIGNSAEEFADCLHECEMNGGFKYIFGFGGAFGEDTNDLLDIRAIHAMGAKLEALLTDVRQMRSDALLAGQQELFSSFHGGLLEDAKRTALAIVYHVQIEMLNTGGDFWHSFHTKIQSDYYQQIACLEDVSGVERWISHFLLSAVSYYEATQPSVEVDSLEKARRFIMEHYTDSDLNLTAVARHVDLNQKYLCSQFSKRFGKSFVSYLTELRLNHAKQLILKTDMKIYEICYTVGFSSVEHFIRLFKKATGVTPNLFHGSGSNSEN